MTADALVRAHADLAYRVALRVTGSPADAADAAQDALVKVWQHGEAVETERRQAWVARVARNAALDLVRRRRARPQPGLAEAVAEPSSDAPLPDDDAEASDLRAGIEGALATLDEPYRSLLVLRDVEGLAYAEVADALDLPLNTMKVYLHRARRRFQTALATASPDLVP